MYVVLPILIIVNDLFTQSIQNEMTQKLNEKKIEKNYSHPT